MKKFFKSIKIAEWLIWSISVVAATASFFAFKNTNYHYLAGAIIGFTVRSGFNRGVRSVLRYNFLFV